jgi:hypothetical protein
MIARKCAQIEPLVRIDWVPQNKYLNKKDLDGAGNETRGSHKNQGD